MGEHTEVELTSAQVDAVRARREALHEAVGSLEDVLGGLDRDAPDPEVLRGPVEHLVTVLREHARGAEAVDGPLAQVMENAPWLGNRVTRLRSEHPTLIARAEELGRRLDDDHVGPSVIADARALASQVDAHRHQAASLLLDAYSLDLSAGD